MSISPEFGGRFKRVDMELQVEVIGEEAVKADGGSMTAFGFDGQVASALGRVAVEAWREAELTTGIRFVSLSGPYARLRDETGAYVEVTLPKMPHRRSDGEFEGDLGGDPSQA